METLCTEMINPRRHLDMQEVSTRFDGLCSILGFHLMNQLPSDMMQNVLSYLPNRDLRQMDQVSRAWHWEVQSLKKHHNTLVQTKYALEMSYFGSREVKGWLDPCLETAIRVIKFAPTGCTLDEDEFEYVHFLAAYRAEYRSLCSLVLTFVKAARPGLNLDPDALYRVLLEWNTWQWRGHQQHPVSVLGQEGERTSKTVILDFLPKSLLVYLVRGRSIFDGDKDCNRDAWVKKKKKAFRW